MEKQFQQLYRWYLNLVGLLLTLVNYFSTLNSTIKYLNYSRVLPFLSFEPVCDVGQSSSGGDFDSVPVQTRSFISQLPDQGTTAIPLSRFTSNL